jgi:hypothetical protein
VVDTNPMEHNWLGVLTRARRITLRGYRLTTTSAGTTTNANLGAPPLSQATVCPSRPQAGTRLSGPVYLIASYNCSVDPTAP